MIILGIVALIATPTITNITKESKMSTYKSSVENLFDFVNINMIETKNYTDTYYIYDKYQFKIVTQGQQPDKNIITTGINIDAEGKIYVNFLKRKFVYFYNDKYCAYSNKDTAEITVIPFESEKDCMSRAQFYSWIEDEMQFGMVQLETIEEFLAMRLRVSELTMVF